MDGTLHVELVGCGRIARVSHLPAIAATPAITMLTLFDTDPDALAGAIAQMTGEGWALRGEFQQDARVLGASAILTRPGADHTRRPTRVAVLTGPSHLHPAHAIYLASNAAEYGRMAIASEKPMATSLDQADAMIRACERANIPGYLIHQNRFNAAVQFVEKVLREGALGRLTQVTARVYWQRPQSYYDQAGWRGRQATDGGALLNQAAHYVDLLRWFGGSVDDLQATIATQLRAIEAEDSAVVGCRFRTGALGLLEVSMLTYPRNLEGSLTLLGERGTLKIGGTALNRVEWCEVADLSPALQEEASQLVGTGNPDSVYGTGHQEFYRRLPEATRVRNGGLGARPALPTFRDGRQSLEFILGAYLSHRRRAAVSLPLASDPHGWLGIHGAS